MKFRSSAKVNGFVVAALLCGGLASVPAFAAKDPNPIIVEPGRGGEPGGAHVAKDFNGHFETRENLLLHLTTDLGTVHIITLERGAAPVVRYTVHVETDAREPLASQLLEHYALNAKGTAGGVETTGNLPEQL